jgi:hypothetical protein
MAAQGPPTYNFWTYSPNPFSDVRVRFPKLINMLSDDLDDWKAEEARLTQQYDLYQNDFLNSTGQRKVYMDTMAQRISEELDNIEVTMRVIMETSNTKENTRTNTGRGLSYKGKHHGYIRRISRMAKGL